MLCCSIGLYLICVNNIINIKYIIVLQLNKLSDIQPFHLTVVDPEVFNSSLQRTPIHVFCCYWCSNFDIIYNKLIIL